MLCNFVKLLLLAVIWLCVVALAGCGGSAPVVVPPAWPQARTLTQVENPGDAVTDGQDLYFVSVSFKPAYTALLRVPLAGGPTATVVKGDYFPTQLLLDENFIYWADGRWGAIMRVNVGGGEPQKVVGGLSRPQYLAVDGGRVYWINGGPAAESGKLQSVNKFEPGEITTLDSNSSNNHVQVDATHVYWMTSQGLRWLDKLDNQTGTLYDAAGHVTVGLAQDTESLYFFQQYDDNNIGLIKMPKAGGNATQIVAGKLATTLPLAVDEQSIYFFSRDGLAGIYTLRKIPKDGGVAAPLDAGPAQGVLAIGPANIYLTDKERVLALPK